MTKYFDIQQLEEQQVDQVPEDKADILVTRFLQLHFFKIKSLKDLMGRYPMKDEQYFLWTLNSFNAFTFIPYIIKVSGPIQELILSTYSINIRIIDALVRLIDKGLILSVDITISDSVRSRLPKVYDRLMVLTESKPVRVNYTWNHSKIALIHSGDNYFDVEGSGNWGENAQYEQYVFNNMKSVFEFRKNGILHGINPVTV